MSKLHIGLVGVSHRAKIAEHWDKDGRAEIVAGCDIHDRFLEEFQARYGRDTFVTHDFRELAARDDLDAVGIFAPDDVHEASAVAALEGGKHVYLEKPMAITIEGCDNIMRAERESGRKLMIGFNMRYMTVVEVMRDVVQSGQIGRVTAVWVRHFVGRGGRAYFHDYRANRRGSNTLLLQKASHDLDVVHYVTGQYARRVAGMGGLDYYGGDMPNDLRCENCDRKETCPDFSDRDGADKTMCCFRREVDVEDHSMLLMEYSGGARGLYAQCHYAPDQWRNYVFMGEKGRVENLKDGRVQVLTQTHNTGKRGFGEPYSEAYYHPGSAAGGHGGSDPRITKDFLNYVIDDVTPRATSLDGRMAVAVGVKGAESIRDGGMPLVVSEPENETPADTAYVDDVAAGEETLAQGTRSK